MDILTEGLKVVSEVKDWVTLVAGIAFMIIFWEPIAQKLGWKGRNTNETAGAVNLSSAKREVMADFRNAIAPLHLEMQQLSQHFNHETTDNQKDIQAALEAIHETTTATSQILKEIKEYGIKCRKD